jgi:chromate reductase
MKQQINDIDMKKILIIGASSHVQSVNKQFATYAGSKVGASDLTVLDLNDFEMEIFSQDRESATGIPEKAKAFVRAVESADGIILSLAEHNGSYTAAFKNVLDWASRSKQKFWSQKPMLLLSTSPGSRGGANVLASAKGYFPHMGAQITSSFALPAFFQNFDAHTGIKDPELAQEFEQAMDQFLASLNR